MLADRISTGSMMFHTILNFSLLQTLVEILTTLAFALSGMMEAARKRLDMVGVCVVVGLRDSPKPRESHISGGSSVDWIIRCKAWMPAFEMLRELIVEHSGSHLKQMVGSLG